MPPGAAPGLPACYGRIWRSPGPAMLCKGCIYYIKKSTFKYCKRVQAEQSVRNTLFLQHQLAALNSLTAFRMATSHSCSRMLYDTNACMPSTPDPFAAGT